MARFAQAVCSTNRGHGAHIVERQAFQDLHLGAVVEGTRFSLGESESKGTPTRFRGPPFLTRTHSGTSRLILQCEIARHVAVPSS